VFDVALCKNTNHIIEKGPDEFPTLLDP
jgi:hypothetical protein